MRNPIIAAAAVGCLLSSADAFAGGFSLSTPSFRTCAVSCSPSLRTQMVAEDPVDVLKRVNSMMSGGSATLAAPQAAVSGASSRFGGESVDDILKRVASMTGPASATLRMTAVSKTARASSTTSQQESIESILARAAAAVAPAAHASPAPSRRNAELMDVRDADAARAEEEEEEEKKKRNRGGASTTQG
mmetsp:Transcript_88750/g.129764  ORF Transcript_88750/g.129764 Transcript_88750/m.129764 type:complete len:189 (-) Transcript_88750:939-1505(-)